MIFSVLCKGFKLGLLLQLAVGPVCLFVFGLAGTQGFVSAEQAVLAVTLVDAAYIGLALMGMTAFLRHERIQRILRWLGAGVLLLYGVQSVVAWAGWRILPEIALFKNSMVGGPFWQGLFLTASNPLTILFWAGVLTARATEERLNEKALLLFGIGCVGATLFFLSAIAGVGTLTRQFLPQVALFFLNGAVGLLLIYFAVRMAGNWKRPRPIGERNEGGRS